jgi:hypothetical protein
MHEYVRNSNNRMLLKLPPNINQDYAGNIQETTTFSN